MSCSTDLSQIVQLSDDENTENVNSKGTMNVSPDEEDVIIIADDSLPQKSQNANDNCIETNSRFLCNKNVTNYDDIYKENKLFAEYLEKLLNLENSEGMYRIVNRNLLKKYRECKEYFRKSNEFDKILKKSIRLLELAPDHKFSNIKNMCTVLKNNGIRRIAPTLLNKELKSFTDHIMKRNIQPTDLNKKKKLDTIDLENYNSSKNLDDQPMEVIDLDNSQNVVIDIEKENVEDHDNDVEHHGKVEDHHGDVVDSNKNFVDHENEAKEVIKKNNSYLVPLSEVEWKGSPIKDRNKESVTNENEIIDVDEEDFNKSQRETVMRIKSIEKKIAYYIVIIEKLEQEEVSNYDSEESPYILSEKFKAKIVKLYETLCELTGSESVKHHTVRLDVLAGHPSGAVKFLEAFINNNIGSDGLPPFPDINDVIKCVEMANKQDNLNWNRRQIMKEASALFTQCGRALQKRRQRREYRDLMSRVTRARVQMTDDAGLDGDPADQDPSLQAKLEENRRIALKKEQDLLEQYTRMELKAIAGPLNSNLNHSNSSKSQITLESNITNDETTHIFCQVNNIESLSTAHNKNSETITASEEPKVTVTNKIETNVKQYIGKDQSQIVDIKSENQVTRNTHEIDETSSNTQNIYQEVTVNQEPNVKQKETQDQVDFVLSQKHCILKEETKFLHEDDMEVIPDVKIKQEQHTEMIPDIKNKQKQLDSLFSGMCEDYEVTVFDIEDPFLTIEISDSSDDD